MWIIKSTADVCRILFCDAGPTSATLGQCQIYNGSIYRVCWNTKWVSEYYFMSGPNPTLIECQAYITIESITHSNHGVCTLPRWQTPDLTDTQYIWILSHNLTEWAYPGCWDKTTVYGLFMAKSVGLSPSTAKFRSLVSGPVTTVNQRMVNV